MKIKLVETIVLEIGNRDGDLIMGLDAEGSAYLILEAQTLHNEEVFQGLGSTDHIRITKEAYEAFKKMPPRKDDPDAQDP